MTSIDNKVTKWALLIGINQYARPYISQLNGCVNDVELVANILHNNFGFPANNIILLRNAEATRDAILAAMDLLVDRVAEDDIVVIYYSGHGSQMTDREGDELDKLDETIVAYDSGRRPDPNRDITDDEIYARLLHLSKKTPYTTLIFDCCHSGTIARDPFGVQARWVEPDERPAEELPPSPVGSDVIEAISRSKGPSGWFSLGERYVLIAGCRDEELAYEYYFRQYGSTVIHGALTYFLCQELSKSQPGATYRDVFERASTQVTAELAYQHPQMEGARDREVFGVRDIQPMRFVPIKQRTGNQVTLGAGAAHGMTVGSQWTVYPQTLKQVTESTPKLGVVEVTTVRAVTSDAKILDESEAGSIVTDTRAVEEDHFYGEMRLVVEIVAPAGYEQDVSELTNLIEDSDLLRMTKAGEEAKVRAYIIPPRAKIGQTDPVPQLKNIAEPTWAVVGQDGRLMMPAHIVAQAGVTKILRKNLEKLVRYQQALKLENVNTNSLLKGKVIFNLIRQIADGTWVAAEPENAGGHIFFTEGQRIGFEVTNQHNKPIYISVLDFGLTGAIGLLYPIEGAKERLIPGNTIQVGVREGDELTLYMPDNFPYMPDPEDKEPAGGTETFKLFATIHEADFSGLVQEGVRGTSVTPVEQLLSMALTGHGNRDTRHNRVPEDEEWTAVERSFFLRTKGKCL